jgi:hypothetical protein
MAASADPTLHRIRKLPTLVHEDLLCRSPRAIFLHRPAQINLDKVVEVWFTYDDTVVEALSVRAGLTFGFIPR